MRRLLPLVAVLLLGSGCASTMIDGDRYFLAGDLAQAESAYRDYLTGGRAEGNTEARARYRLGLIYALPESDLHDWEKAQIALGSLVDIDPGGSWAQQAALLLDLWRERDRLTSELERQRSQADFLLGEVAKIQGEADRAEDEVEDREARVETLTREIGRLKWQMEELGTELEAREEELDRIKKIDLETPP